MAGWDICLLASNCLFGDDPRAYQQEQTLQHQSEDSAVSSDLHERRRCNKLCQDLFDLIGKWCNQREISLFNSEHLLHSVFPDLEEIEEELGLGSGVQQVSNTAGDSQQLDDDGHHLEKIVRKYFKSIYQYMSLVRLLAICNVLLNYSILFVNNLTPPLDSSN